MWGLFLKVILIFFITSNLMLLFMLHRSYNKQKKNDLLFFFSAYGVGPFLSGILFFYSIKFLPNREFSFYYFVVIFFWIFLTAIFFRSIVSVRNFYRRLFKNIKNITCNKKSLIGIIPVFLISLFFIQSLCYPIIGNDQSLYLNQSEGYAKFRNLDWQKKKIIEIRDGDQYKYNSSISPGIPSLVAFSLGEFKENRSVDYLFFQFLFFYYSMLLFLIFLYIIYLIAKSLNKNPVNAILYGMIVFVFSWRISRLIMMNSKESIIYFFTLLSILILFNLLDKKRNVWLEFILGLVLGTNMFINLHGIVIGLLILLLLFLFSSLTIWGRIKQLFFIFISSQLAGGFELIKNIKFLLTPLVNFFETKINNKEVSAIKSGKGLIKVSNNHMKLYQFNTEEDLYLKGKFQLVTNFGVYGFSFWLFIVSLFFNFKYFLKNKYLKVIVSFVGIYFILVLDLFSINSHPMSIVLSGSNKYSSLLLLLILIILGVFLNTVIKKTFKLIIKFNSIFLILSSILLVIFTFHWDNIINFSINIFIHTSQIYKNLYFYENKISLFFIAVIFIISAFFITQVYYQINKNKKIIYNIYAFLFITLFIIMPFGIISSGKLSLTQTIQFLFKSREEKLEKTINNGEVYKVFHYAKKILPKNSKLGVEFNEIYIYDDYFMLSRNKNDVYSIRKKCINSEEMYSSKSAALCKK